MTLIATRVKLGMHICIWGTGYKPEMKDLCIQGSREIGGIVIESPKTDPDLCRGHRSGCAVRMDRAGSGGVRVSKRRICTMEAAMRSVPLVGLQACLMEAAGLGLCVSPGTLGGQP